MRTVDISIYNHDRSCHMKVGMWICEGMYVVEALDIPQRRQGWVTEVIDENDGVGKIKVQVVRKAGEILDEQFFYVTEPEPGNNWCKALVDG